MGNIPYFDILILAMIAIFIFNRLRNVLGKKTGNENELVKRQNFKETKPDNESYKVVSEKEVIDYPQNKKVNEYLNKIKQIEGKFDLEDFLIKAKKAFEFILKSYSESNLKRLESLLDKDIFSEYEKDIENRLKKKENFQITLIGVNDPLIKEVSLVKNIAKIVLQYDSEQIHVTRNSNGDIIEGDINQILSIKEKWTFSRKLNSKNQNWTLQNIAET